MEQDDVGLGDLSSDGNSFFFFFFNTIISVICVILTGCLSSEMSVDSDRDSVIESEDGKEAIVRRVINHFTL